MPLEFAAAINAVVGHPGTGTVHTREYLKVMRSVAHEINSRKYIPSGV